MASNLNRGKNVTAKGIVSINEDDKVVLEIDEVGDVPVSEVLKDFEGEFITLKVTLTKEGL